MKKGYRDAPYHNWIHAFSVTHFSYLLMKNLRLIDDNYISSLEAFVFLVSCLCHDIDHRGTNNSFQTKCGTVLASLYSSEGSVMEVRICFLFINQKNFKIKGNWLCFCLATPLGSINVHFEQRRVQHFWKFVQRGLQQGTGFIEIQYSVDGFGHSLWNCRETKGNNKRGLSGCWSRAQEIVAINVDDLLRPQWPNEKVGSVEENCCMYHCEDDKIFL